MGNHEPLAVPAATSLFSSGQDPLQSCEFGQLARQVPWIADALPGGERGQVIDAEVYPHVHARPGVRSYSFVQAEAHKVPPRTVLGYRDRAGLALELLGLAGAQVPYLGKPEVALLPVPSERGTGELRALHSALRLETRVGRPLLKEVTVGRLQVPEALLEWDTGNLVQPPALGLLLPSRQRGAGLLIANLGFVPGVTFLSQTKRAVVNMANTPKRLPERPALAGARIASEGDPHFHGHALAS